MSAGIEPRGELATYVFPAGGGPARFVGMTPDVSPRTAEKEREHCLAELEATGRKAKADLERAERDAAERPWGRTHAEIARTWAARKATAAAHRRFYEALRAAYAAVREAEGGTFPRHVEPLAQLVPEDSLLGGMVRRAVEIAHGLAEAPEKVLAAATWRRPAEPPPSRPRGSLVTPPGGVRP